MAERTAIAGSVTSSARQPTMRRALLPQARHSAVPFQLPTSGRGVPGTAAAGAGERRGARLGAGGGGLAGSLAAAASEPVRYQQPKDALAAIRRGLAQSRTPIAFILDFADLLLTDPQHNDRSDRDLLLMVKKAMMESTR